LASSLLPAAVTRFFQLLWSETAAFNRLFRQEKAELNNAGKATRIGKTPFFPGFFWDPSFPGSGVYRFQEGS
jgi:hypothetical protein